MYICISCDPGTVGDLKRVLYMLELDLLQWAATWIPEIDSGSSGSAASAINH